MSLGNLISALLSILKYLKPQNYQGPREKNEGGGQVRKKNKGQKLVKKTTLKLFSYRLYK